ncbi:hypothetical protein I7X12_11240 [Halosimplex litoreum]|uniref:Uncharacterized protein n=1 Tax=Halosimplex litoreum TaxID=1198301 RepID=A0A7T3KTT9_9EURY|nr:hypothetical protein [Halosimplex litoreum]QPV61344.1 hypothetical protein I7X12_11240 [Halosimplex litoreum]
MPSNSTADRSVRTTDSSCPASDGDRDERGDDDLSVRRATQIMRLLKLVATTLAALTGAAKALGLV